MEILMHLLNAKYSFLFICAMSSWEKLLWMIPTNSHCSFRTLKTVVDGVGVQSSCGHSYARQ
ncbi:unnamed protein product, partial [Brassica oleracea]